MFKSITRRELLDGKFPEYMFDAVMIRYGKTNTRIYKSQKSNQREKIKVDFFVDTVASYQINYSTYTFLALIDNDNQVLYLSDGDDYANI